MNANQGNLKKGYHAPKIMDYGNVKEITASAGRRREDNRTLRTRSGA